MLKEQSIESRELKTAEYRADLVVTGGGLAGVCCAITAAREGIKVILVQDRPVLGGNSSSEVRLWVLGATSHMGNNNRWAREGGVIDEIMTENIWRNPEGNPLIYDTILLEKVTNEPNITLLLNTAAFEVQKSGDDTIESVTAFCSQNSTLYHLKAPLFCDASGDGVVGFLAGAAFRMGAESESEFGEKFAPSKEYGELLGHSLYFYTKDTGRPVKFVPPAYALKDITEIPRYKRINAQAQGCQFWWLEYGGRLDTVHDTEAIKWELWKVVYGIWNYIKNSGEFPEAETMTLEWVGQIPGKRESRRFEGDYMLCQQDIVEQRTHKDAVAFGGWSIDLHPADGVFSEKPACNQWHSKGVYQIPFRSMYSHNIGNLLLAGRIISATHVAFGSSRVMGTSACAAQAAGMAAVLCTRHNVQPRALLQEDKMQELQVALVRNGQYIPQLVAADQQDLVAGAAITASSEYILKELAPDGGTIKLDASMGQLLPLRAGQIPAVTVFAEVQEDTELVISLRTSSRQVHHTPDVILQELTVPVIRGAQELTINFDVILPEDNYIFLCFMKNPLISLKSSSDRVSGVLTVFNKTNPAVSNYGAQVPTEDIGVEAFEFWCPERRPAGKNLALVIPEGIALFGAENIRNGINRPTHQPNIWLAAEGDADPAITLTWPEKQTIREIELVFDTDFDHPMENVIYHHPETAMPFCVQSFVLCNDKKEAVLKVTDNHQSLHRIKLKEPLHTGSLTLHLQGTHGGTPAGLFAIRCY
ncbi:FAD-dependent oxidoreductase [Chitinophaga sp. sic0106]|uniref:FAD-dependent oxidoreductase n=1 Tax=Chitinophaga sp. sic0106 TaxID=2854785 RepID=UPI001C45ABEC|nr:FAD-dependent oxidoreductase [Chitinophaga sp. sic0106]MBV7532527.1 FAD-dependent oxidoreductase [Chitinophaga sp. sic0106]